MNIDRGGFFFLIGEDDDDSGGGSGGGRGGCGCGCGEVIMVNGMFFYPFVSLFFGVWCSKSTRNACVTERATGHFKFCGTDGYKCA